eukprot:GHVP01004791.1.p1 GENE.GHVP01004791.1~~GHVP01004791.1.p1  ORF type:complete len:561 (+),score=111.44 GHVP01004791.1:52-1683(+)
MEKVFLPNAAVPLMPREPEFISLNPPILEENLDAEAKKKIHSRRYSLSHSHSHRNRNRHRHRQNDSSLSSSSLLSYTGILIGVVVTSLALWTAWTTTWKTASQPTTDYDLPNTQNHPSNKDVKPQRGTKDLEAGQNLNQSPKEDQKRKDNDAKDKPAGCFSDTSPSKSKDIAKEKAGWIRKTLPSTGYETGTKILEAGQNLNHVPKEDQKQKDVEAAKEKAGWIRKTLPSTGYETGTKILEAGQNLNHVPKEDQKQKDVEAAKEKAGWIRKTLPSTGYETGTNNLEENSDSGTNLNHYPKEDQTQGNETSSEQPQSCQELIQVFCNFHDEHTENFHVFRNLFNNDNFLKGCYDEARKIIDNKSDNIFCSWSFDPDQHPVLTADKSKTNITEKTIEGQKVSFLEYDTPSHMDSEVLCTTKNYQFIVEWLLCAVTPISCHPEQDADCLMTRAFCNFISSRKNLYDAQQAITEFPLKSESYQEEFDAKMSAKLNTFSKTDIFKSIRKYSRGAVKPAGGDFKNFEVKVERSLNGKDWELEINPIGSY